MLEAHASTEIAEVAAADRVPLRGPGRRAADRLAHQELAFDTSLGKQGWQLVSLPGEYQSDGSSCGVWLHEVLDTQHKA